METKETSDGTVTYKDDQNTRDIVFEKVLAFFLRLECFNGECCVQNDDPQLEAPELLAKLADDVFQFYPETSS